MVMLSSARSLAAANLTRSQAKSKNRYDQDAREWNLFREIGYWSSFPVMSQENTISYPNPGMGCIVSWIWMRLTYPRRKCTKLRNQIHRSRVTPFPSEMPAGFFWYGRKHNSCSNRLPQWIEDLLLVRESREENPLQLTAS